MKIFGDYHTHTFASDGRCSLFAQAKKAKDMGLCEIAITDHSFASFIFHMTRKKFAKQQAQIAKIGDIHVLHGVEANLVNEDGDIDVPNDIIEQCDILQLGFHRFLDVRHIRQAKSWLFTNGYASEQKRRQLIDTNTRAYELAMKKYPIDCLAHLNHRALVDVRRLCAVAKENDVYIEFNQKHINALEKYADCLCESGVKLLVGTDAHDVSKTGKIDDVLDFVKRHNIPLSNVYGIDDNVPKFKNKKGFDI